MVGTGHSSVDNHIVVGSFECDYRYYTFDYNHIVDMKVKKLNLYMLCRIALKLE